MTVTVYNTRQDAINSIAEALWACDSFPEEYFFETLCKMFVHPWPGRGGVFYVAPLVIQTEEYAELVHVLQESEDVFTAAFWNAVGEMSRPVFFCKIGCGDDFTQTIFLLEDSQHNFVGDHVFSTTAYGETFDPDVFDLNVFAGEVEAELRFLGFRPLPGWLDVLGEEYPVIRVTPM